MGKYGETLKKIKKNGKLLRNMLENEEAWGKLEKHGKK